MVPVTRAGESCKMGGKVMPCSPPAETCLAMYRAEALTLADRPGDTTLPMELVETSAIAGRTMVTGLGAGLRLTAIVDRPPAARIGDLVQFSLPSKPDTWFAADRARIG